MEYLKDFFGIVIYSIENDGCLNGLWTNIKNKGEIMNEIAKIKKYKTCNDKESKKEPNIEGEYNVAYIEEDMITYNGLLTIDLVKDDEDTYYILNWYFKKDDTRFFGKGFIIGKQFIVSYC